MQYFIAKAVQIFIVIWVAQNACVTKTLTGHCVIICLKEFCFDNGDGDLDDPVAGVDAQADDGGPQCHARHTFGQTRLGNGHQFTHFGGIHLQNKCSISWL